MVKQLHINSSLLTTLDLCLVHDRVLFMIYPKVFLTKNIKNVSLVLN